MKARVRAISETTWRVRAARRSLPSAAVASSRSSTSTSWPTPRMRADSSQSARRDPYWPSASECLARVSMTRSSRPTALRSKGTWRVDMSRQSRASAWPSRQRRDAVWSRPPVFAPATWFSAARAASTSTLRPSSLGASIVPARPSEHTSSRATAVAHSSAALDERPPPRGTHDHRAASKPGSGPYPACSSAHATPARYAVQWFVTSPGVPFGPITSRSRTSIASRVCGEIRRIVRSSRGDSAT